MSTRVIFYDEDDPTVVTDIMELNCVCRKDGTFVEPICSTVHKAVLNGQRILIEHVG